jgi:hypothetical protein
MKWPEQSWLAKTLIAGNLLVPAITFFIAATAETPTGDAIDWKAESPKARFIDGLLVAHLCYALTLVMVMRGCRLVAFVLGFLALLLAVVVNFFAYFYVTGVYW